MKTNQRNSKHLPSGAAHLDRVLSQPSLIERVATKEEILELAAQKRRVQIGMGKTFDNGQPLDMLKYALFMMNLEDALRYRGAEVTSTWMMADHFISDINKDAEREEVSNNLKKRMTYLKKINKVYCGNIGFSLTSDLSNSEEYARNLCKLKLFFENNAIFRKKLIQSVPEDRRNLPGSINYSLEELATIQAQGLDIKVGPKYEALYDLPAREASQTIGFKKYCAVHLTNSMPLGNPKLKPDIKKVVEEFGVLPYKISSKGLREYRIDPESDSIDKIEKLIEDTADKRALIHLLTITELARQRLEGQTETSFFSEKGRSFPEETSYSAEIYGSHQNLEILKDLAFGSYKKYIGGKLAKR